MQSRVTGTTMPVLEFILDPNESVISEAGELSWMSASIQMTTHTQFAGGGGLFGVLKRVAGGGSIFMTEYRAIGAPGELAVAKSSAIPDVGQRPPAIATDTAASVNGNTALLTTRIPPESMHSVSFDQVLRQEHLDLTAVVFLQVDDEEIIHRVTGRWSCPKPQCKRTYHVVSNPPRVAGYCDADGTALIQREDDKVDTLRERQYLEELWTSGRAPWKRWDE